MKLALMIIPLILAPAMAFADWQGYLQNQTNNVINNAISNANIPPNVFNANPQKIQNVTSSGIQVGFDLIHVFSDTHNLIVAIVDLFTNAYNIPVLVTWGVTWVITAILALKFMKKTAKSVVFAVILILGIVLLFVALGFVHH